MLPYLLPRQLDEHTAGFLTRYLESQGLHIICGTPVKKVHVDPYVTHIEMEDGREYPAQIVFQQMGIIPSIQLAKDSGLPTENGILVNEFMQTANPDIYACGDCIQFKKSVWGIIPASLDQSRQAANAILGKNPPPYQGTFWNTRLKVAGVQLACFGSPPTKGSTTEEVMDYTDSNCNVCRKVVLEGNALKGAILLGGGDEMFFQKNIGKPVEKDVVLQKLYEKAVPK